MRFSYRKNRGPAYTRGVRMGIKERAEKRRAKMVGHRAGSFAEAEQWDLDFWLAQTPQQRLSALVAIRRDILKVKKAVRPSTPESQTGKSEKWKP